MIFMHVLYDACAVKDNTNCRHINYSTVMIVKKIKRVQRRKVHCMSMEHDFFDRKHAMKLGVYRGVKHEGRGIKE